MAMYKVHPNGKVPFMGIKMGLIHRKGVIFYFSVKRKLSKWRTKRRIKRIPILGRILRYKMASSILEKVALFYVSQLRAN